MPIPYSSQRRSTGSCARRRTPCFKWHEGPDRRRVELPFDVISRVVQPAGAASASKHRRDTSASTTIGGGAPRARHRLRGARRGAVAQLLRLASGWPRLKAVAYGSSRRSSTSELEKGLQAFAASDKPVFWLYILSTDAMGHEYGPTALAEFLSDVDGRALERPARVCTRSTLLHGARLRSRHGRRQRSSSTRGRPCAKRCRTPDSTTRASSAQAGDAIFVPLGILTFFFVHTWPGDEAPRRSGPDGRARRRSVRASRRCRLDGARPLGSGADPATRASARRLSGRIAPNAAIRLPYLPIVDVLRTRAHDSQSVVVPGRLVVCWRPSPRRIRMRCTGSPAASRMSATRRLCCARCESRLHVCGARA